MTIRCATQSVAKIWFHLYTQHDDDDDGRSDLLCGLLCDRANTTHRSLTVTAQQERTEHKH